MAILNGDTGSCSLPVQCSESGLPYMVLQTAYLAEEVSGGSGVPPALARAPSHVS